MDKKKKYLELLIEKQLSFDRISKELEIDRKVVSNWYEELRSERESLAKVRTIWLKKELQDISLMEFNEWYNRNRKCYYCGITEDEIAILFDENQIYTKRNRGKKLEIDRKMPEKKYKDDIAINLAKKIFADKKIIPIKSNELAKDTGILNCMTWNIKTEHKT